jgi:light-regulated signal transduction histidine kinase (bacteriophytochrome)
MGTTGRSDAMLHLVVEGNGVGFDEKYLDRIFKVFQRLHGRTEYEGTGIGLSVCRKIAERHGEILPRRARRAKGASVIVSLPLRHLNRKAS